MRMGGSFQPKCCRRRRRSRAIPPTSGKSSSGSIHTRSRGNSSSSNGGSGSRACLVKTRSGRSVWVLVRHHQQPQQHAEPLVPLLLDAIGLLRKRIQSSSRRSSRCSSNKAGRSALGAV